MCPATAADRTLDQIRALLDRLDPSASATCDVPGWVHHAAGREWSAVTESSSW